MAVLSKIKSHPSAVAYFKELPFYNKPIEKTKIKHLKNSDLFSKLPFCEQLSIAKTNQAFRGYAISYRVETIERKDPIVQLESSKLSIKDLFSNLLNEIKGFKYQITVKVLLKKYKLNGEIEYAPVSFNSTTKTVINDKFRLEKSFEEILYMLNAWINKGSGWSVKSIEPQYINISTYRPLSGSSYIGLPEKLKSPKTGLINIKNKDQRYFLWCPVRHINPSKEHPEKIGKIYKKLVRHITNLEEITEEDKEFISNLDYNGIEFPVQEKDFDKIDVKNNACIKVSCYENGLVFPIYVWDQRLEESIDLLLLIDNDKSHYVYIKDFNRFMFRKTKNKNKNWFCRSCLQCFSSENVLSINGVQSVKLEEGTTEFENYFKF